MGVNQPTRWATRDAVTLITVSVRRAYLSHLRIRRCPRTDVHVGSRDGVGKYLNPYTEYPVGYILPGVQWYTCRDSPGEGPRNNRTKSDTCPSVPGRGVAFQQIIIALHFAIFARDVCVFGLGTSDACTIRRGRGNDARR